ncbi:MAG TPA: hypothetical protein VFM18_05105 [Methanosarcina sp.]|nr:hypothetical protein [Methanosarcina sp.]
MAQLKTHLKVLLITDHSISMGNRTEAARQDFNRIIRTLRQQHYDTGMKISVTHIKCGFRQNYYGCETINHTEFIDRDINYVAEMEKYESNGSNTPLFDAASLGFGYMGNAATIDPCLALIITDGKDNASTMSGATLGRKVRDLQATDRYTITFSVPYGDKSYLVGLGIPSDNIQEWELSSKGMETASIARSSSLASYTTAVASGSITSTNKFYTNLNNVSQETIKATLKDISQEVLILPVSGAEGQQIRDFVEKRINKKMKTGSAFYQLTKTESTVQPNKVILVRDKTSNAIYSGNAARDLLNLPKVGNIKLVPGQHGNYDVFIQSTSVNRKLDANTQLIYWENFDGSFIHVKVNTPQVVAPVQNLINTLVNQVHVQKDTSSNKSADALKNYLDAINSTIPADPIKPVKKAAIAPKKAVASPVKVAQETKKKRIRNRNTIQEQIRRFINDKASNPIAIKRLVNGVQVNTLGFDMLSLLNLTPELERKFNAFIPTVEIAKSKTVGEIVELVIDGIKS